MNRFLVFGLVGISGAIAAGCPIYSHDDECDSSSDCPWDMVCSAGYCTTAYSYGVGGSVFVPAPQATGGAGGSQPVSSAGGSPDAGQPMPAVGGSQVSVGGSSVNAGGSSDAGVSAGGTTVIPTDDAGPVPVIDSGPGPVIDAGTPPPQLDASAIFCGNPADCPTGQTCATSGLCQTGDCLQFACINQYVCSRTDPAVSCTLADPSACIVDSQCSDGKACIDGMCTLLSELCSDQTQCAGGHRCVEGKCVTSCGTDAQCPTGFRCQTQLGICSVAAKDCSKTNDCGDPALVCIQNACVPRCNAAGPCEQGAGACVSNGCIPTQKTVPECAVDGDTTTCGSGRICLHHHCYVSCESPNETACAGLARFTECKKVTTSSGNHSICGSAQNLGTACDPTKGTACPPGNICIDGFCR